MFRAFLIAIGISMCIVGGECLVVDQAVVTYPSKAKEAETGITRREIKPPEWAPWSLLSGGVVVTLYALTVQRD